MFIPSCLHVCMCSRKCVYVCVFALPSRYRRLRVDPVLPFTGRLPLSLFHLLPFPLLCSRCIFPFLSFSLLSVCQSWAAPPCVSPRPTATRCAYTHIYQLLFPSDQHVQYSLLTGNLLNECPEFV